MSMSPFAAIVAVSEMGTVQTAHDLVKMLEVLGIIFTWLVAFSFVLVKVGDSGKPKPATSKEDN